MSNTDKNLTAHSNNILRRRSNSWNVDATVASSNTYTEIGRIPVVGTFLFNEMRMSEDGQYLVTLDSDGLYDGLRMTPAYSVSNLVSYVSAATTLSNVAMVPKSDSFSFSSNGNVVFMMSDTSGVISSTTLSNSFNIHSAANSSMYIGGNSWMRVNSISPLFVNVAASMSNDGTTLLVSNRLSNVLQYTLSSPGNLETASLTYAWRPALGTNERIDDVFFNYDMSNVYLGCRVSGTSYVTIRQYSLSTPKYINTAVETANTTYSAPTIVDESSIYIDPTGSNAYIMFDSNLNYVRIFQAALTTPNNISTALWSDSNTKVIYTSSIPSHGLSFSNDGKKMTINRGFLESYSLSSGWNVLTANTDVSNVQSELLTYRLSASSRTCSFFNDGRDVVVSFAPYESSPNQTQPVIHKISLSESWNIKSHVKTVSDNGAIFTKSVVTGTATSFTIDGTGTNVYVSGSFSDGSDKVVQFKLATPWDLRTANYFANANTISYTLNSLVLRNIDSNLYLYGTESTSNRIAEYSMASNGDVRTISRTRTNTIVSSSTYNLFTTTSNNKYLYTSSFDVVNRPIVRYDMNNSSNISSYSFSYSNTGRYSYFRDLSETPWNVKGLYVTPDGQRMFLKGTTYLYEYALNTPWDVGSSTYVQKVLSPMGSSTILFYISPNGRRAHSVSTNTVSYVTMSTPWDITSIVEYSASTKQLSAGVLGSLNPVRGMRISPSGSEMIIYGNRYLIGYSLSNFDISTASYTGQSYYNASLGDTLVYDFDVSPSGRVIFLPYPTTTGIGIRKYTSSNTYGWRPNDIYTLLSSTKEIASVPLTAYGFYVDPTGNKAILLDSNTASVYSYTIGG